MQPVDLGCDSRKQDEEVGKQRQEKKTQEGCVHAHMASREVSEGVSMRHHPVASTEGQGSLGRVHPVFSLLAEHCPSEGAFRSWHFCTVAGEGLRQETQKAISAYRNVYSDLQGGASGVCYFPERNEALKLMQSRGPKSRGSRCICNTTPCPIFASDEPTYF